VYDLQQRSTKLDENHNSLKEQVAAVDNRELEHHDQGLQHIDNHQRSLEDLELRANHLREELRVQVEFQRLEGERLKHQTHHRFLDQMDKALLLSSSVERLEFGHQELHDTVNSTISTLKLPKV